ncbi:MAG: exo-alpha-sialidase [Acidobacteria bacterium]|nr:exo-alpha-sialidase [Acidobacteriota bacterium]
MLKSFVLLFGAAAVLSAAPAFEFIYQKAPFPSCHASTIVETRPGEFLAAWFGGAEEGARDVAIWGSRRVDGKWTEPVELARESNTPTWNPVLFHAADRTLWLYYKFGTSPSSWTAGRRASRDDGKTWGAIEHLPAGLIGPVKDKPLVLGNGTIVSGTSVESYRSWAAWIERSTDNGKTWTKHGPITVKRPVEGGVESAPLAAVPGSSTWNQTFGLIQPAVVPLDRKGKRLRLFARATANIGSICYADSNDGGITWTDARPTSLPNPNSGIDAVGLRDGRMVMIYNHTKRGRSPLNLAVSKDGENWNSFLALETEPGEYSYPAIIQARDGSIHATYTWKRKTIRYVTVPLAEIP